MVTCSCCNETMELHKSVNCSICTNSYNIKCADISTAEARKIHSNTGLSWTCRDCAKLGNDIKSLKTVIVELQKDIKALKDTMVTTPASSTLSLFESEKIIQEIGDREKRKNNIIIYGHPESECQTNSEQQDLDAKLINDILTFASIDEPNIRPIRLGNVNRSVESKPRPIKVTLSSEPNVLSLLKKSNNFQSVDKWKNIFLSRDRTLMQREIHNAARAERDERLAKGETNLKIKYKNGIPSVVSYVESSLN